MVEYRSMRVPACAYHPLRLPRHAQLRGRSTMCTMSTRVVAGTRGCVRLNLPRPPVFPPLLELHR